MRALLILLLLVGGALAQDRGAPRGGAAEFWFDPTQLPSFTGTVERYLVNPRGETDALVFREGPQVVFPPEFGAVVRAAIAPGRPIVVWGIRARHAPVITMLAFAPDVQATPMVVERLPWRLPDGAMATMDRIAVSGTVKAPYLAPQGDVMGAILEDGTVVVIPRGTAEALRDLLRPGAKLAAEGPGVDGEAGRAVSAEHIGETAAALRPVPPPAEAQRR
jgi:hypothetical protein